MGAGQDKDRHGSRLFAKPILSNLIHKQEILPVRMQWKS